MNDKIGSWFERDAEKVGWVDDGGLKATESTVGCSRS